MAKATRNGRRPPAPTASLADAAECVFARYGYARVHPPMADDASVVLQLTGEEIRRQLIIGADSSGREICLRPDLTLPACRQLLASGWRGDTVERLSYRGPVFRTDPHGRLKETTQIGIECLGPLDVPLADAEVVAMALRILSDAGQADAVIVLGDVALYQTFLNFAVPSPAQRLRLERSRDDRPAAPLRGLHLLSQSDAESLVSDLMTAVGIDRVGARSLSEIVSRLIDSAAAAEETDERAAMLFARYRAINASPRKALALIEKLSLSAGLTVNPALQAAEARLTLLDALGVDLDRLRFETTLRPDFDYYTGLVFEIRIGDKVVGTGGRYDHLMRSLGFPSEARACGFALTLDASDSETDRSMCVDAVVIDGAPALAIEAAEALRAGGWRVAIEPVAATRSPRFVVSMGGGRSKSVTVEDREKRRRETLSVAALTAFARANPCA